MKHAKPLPDQQTLLRLLRYDSETGRLYWRERENDGGGFNAKYANREALATLTEKGYRRGGLCGRAVMAHRVIWKMLHGTEPVEIDHENGIKSDNRPNNLKDATRVQNCVNGPLRTTNKTGRIGVCRMGAKWRAFIRAEGEQKHLGLFNDFVAASEARTQAERQYGYHENHGRARYVR